jgi:hypothetical protein
MICKKCGRENEDGCVCCDFCGERFAGDRQVNVILSIVVVFVLVKIFLLRPKIVIAPDIKVDSKDQKTGTPAEAAKTEKAQPEEKKQQSTNLGVLSLRINGATVIYTADKAFTYNHSAKQWCIEFKSGKDADKSRIVLFLPKDTGNKSTFVIDSKEINELHFPNANMIFVNKDGESFEFGFVDGDGCGKGRHSGSHATIIIDIWDETGGSAAGTISGSITFNNCDDVVDFDNGIFIAQIETNRPKST